MKLMLTSDTHYGMDGKTQGKHVRFWGKVKQTIEKENVQALIWAGDIACNKQSQLENSLKMAREYVSIPILLVLGNHDFWSDERISLDRLVFRHYDLFTKYDIRYLNNFHFIIDDVLICGFDGWYATNNPPTNDEYNMPITIYGEPRVMNYMVNKAWKDFQACLDLDTAPFRKSIIVTHYNPYPYSGKLVSEHPDDYDKYSANFRFLEEMKGKFDVLCCGHTHKYRNDDREGIQIYNCGSGYNNPKFLVFEV